MGVLVAVIIGLRIEVGVGLVKQPNDFGGIVRLRTANGPDKRGVTAGSPLVDLGAGLQQQGDEFRVGFRFRGDGVERRKISACAPDIAVDFDRTFRRDMTADRLRLLTFVRPS